MLRLKDTIYEDSMDRLWKDYKTLDALRPKIKRSLFLGKWTLRGNHRQVLHILNFLSIKSNSTYFFRREAKQEMIMDPLVSDVVKESIRITKAIVVVGLSSTIARY